MGFFEKLFPNQTQEFKRATETFQGLTWYTPVFTSWNGMLYESELVRSAIDAKARHISKLKVEFHGQARPRLQTKVKHAPNDWMTWSQFLYRLSTILDVNNSAMIIPVKDVFDETIGFFPVLPNECKLLQSKNGDEFLSYKFGNGKTGILPREQCGIMTRFQYSNDFFGEKNTALGPTMDMVEVQNTGIKEAVKNSNTYRFMATLSNFTKESDLVKAQEDFNEKSMRKGKGGTILFPSTWKDVKQVTSTPYAVDPKQMEFIKTNVFNYFGVSEEVLQNKASGDSLDAFFNGAVEPFSIQLSEVMSKMTFTDRERSSGSEIIVTANRLQYMNTQSKISLAQQMGDRGILTVDEIRELFNYSSIGDEVGSYRPARGEYFFIDSDGNVLKKEGEDANQE